MECIHPITIATFKNTSINQFIYIVVFISHIEVLNIHELKRKFKLKKTFKMNKIKYNIKVTLKCILK